MGKYEDAPDSETYTLFNLQKDKFHSQGGEGGMPITDDTITPEN